jgi:hypothetical protein
MMTRDDRNCKKDDTSRNDDVTASPEENSRSTDSNIKNLLDESYCPTSSKVENNGAALDELQ